MKALKHCIMAGLLLLAISCTNPTEMMTVINPDGSCYREFVESADAAFMTGDTTDNKNPFPVTLDSTWQISWTYGNQSLSTIFPLSKAACDSMMASALADESMTGKDKRTLFTVIAHKDYPSVEAMGKSFTLKPSHEWSTMNVSCQLEKKFRWFYTYYEYKEIYPKIETHFALPIGKYMSEDEACFWFTGEPDILNGMNGMEIREYMGDLEDKYNRWFAQNAWNDQYAVLLENYDQLSDKPVTREQLALLKDTIFEKEVKDVQDVDMEKILNKYFQTQVFSELWLSDESQMNVFEHQYAERPFVLYQQRSFNYKLKMPGKIMLPTNAVIKGDTMVWKLTAFRMMHDDYIIRAQSRKSNVWAFIVTGLVLVLAIGSFLYKPKHSRH